MNLKNAQTLEKSLRYRGMSMRDLSQGITARRRGWRLRDHDNLNLSQQMREKLLKTADVMSDTARDLNAAIEEAMRDINIDM